MNDRIPKMPDKTGPAGSMWRVNVDLAMRRAGLASHQHAMLGAWIVEIPGAHPIWHSYHVSLVHLRPIENMPPPILYDRHASHELLIYALDPERPRGPVIDGTIPPSLLTPANFAAQLSEAIDVAAIAKIEGTIDLMLSGELNPDTDFRAQWIALFGNNMVRREYRQ